MIGNWKWNLSIALFTLFLTFVFSFSNHNGFLTSLVRGFYSFGVMFLLVYGFRWLIGNFSGLRELNEESPQSEADKQNEQVGSHINISTPEDAALSTLFAENPETAEQIFTPLKPKQLASTKQLPADFLADAVRNLSDDEG